MGQLMKPYRFDRKVCAEEIGLDPSVRRDALMANRWLIQGALVLDVSSGKTTRQDLGVADGFVCPTDEVDDGARIDAGGLTALFGLWDCHAHPGSLMHDPTGRGYFEGVAEWTVRAGANLMEAAQMGVTGVRAVAEANGIDLSWSPPSLPARTPGRGSSAPAPEFAPLGAMERHSLAGRSRLRGRLSPTAQTRCAGQRGRSSSKGSTGSRSC